MHPLPKRDEALKYGNGSGVVPVCWAFRKIVLTKLFVWSIVIDLDDQLGHK